MIQWHGRFLVHSEELQPFLMEMGTTVVVNCDLIRKNLGKHFAVDTAVNNTDSNFAKRRV